jgi:predicted RNA polymerase sigma factor
MGSLGRFQLEAAVQSAHAAWRFTGTTDWAAIVSIYDALLAMTGSVVVAINRAVAVAEQMGGTRGGAEGLAALDAEWHDRQLADSFKSHSPYRPYTSMYQGPRHFVGCAARSRGFGLCFVR